jgi:hypothetical protein
MCQLRAKFKVDLAVADLEVGYFVLAAQEERNLVAESKAKTENCPSNPLISFTHASLPRAADSTVWKR